MIDDASLWLVTILIAAIPAFAAMRLAAGKDHKLPAQLFVFAGVLLYFLPVALFAALIVMFMVFGIDMVD